MRVVFTGKTKEDFRKHNDYIRKQRKSDGHIYQSYELKGIKKSFKKNLEKNLEQIKDHKDSIFPKEFEYSSDSYKMFVDKKSHYVVFYTVETTKSGEKIIKVRKSIHSTELKQELEEKGIKPLKDCDKSLLNDLKIVYKEDGIRLKDNSNEEKENITEPETCRKIKRVKHTGPRGGHYYINDKGIHIYPKEWNESIKNFNSLKSYIIESKIITLLDYFKKKIG